jgi:hypothetical protein
MSDGTETTKAKSFPKNRRRRKYIWPEIQLKIAFQMLFVALPVLFFYLVLLYDGAMSHDETLSQYDSSVFQAAYGVIINGFLISCLIAIPFALGIGVLSSFPFSGPIYRFNCYLSGLVTGRWDEPCRLRKGDNLQALNESVNAAVGHLTGHIRRQHELLEQARRLLADPAAAFADADKSRELAEAIAAQQTEVAARLGTQAEEENEAPSAPAPLAEQTASAG